MGFQCMSCDPRRTRGTVLELPPTTCACAPPCRQTGRRCRQTARRCSCGSGGMGRHVSLGDPRLRTCIARSACTDALPLHTHKADTRGLGGGGGDGFGEGGGGAGDGGGGGQGTVSTCPRRAPPGKAEVWMLTSAGGGGAGDSDASACWDGWAHARRGGRAQRSHSHSELASASAIKSENALPARAPTKSEVVKVPVKTKSPVWVGFSMGRGVVALTPTGTRPTTMPPLAVGPALWMWAMVMAVTPVMVRVYS